MEFSGLFSLTFWILMTLGKKHAFEKQDQIMVVSHAGSIFTLINYFAPFLTGGVFGCGIGYVTGLQVKVNYYYYHF